MPIVAVESGFFEALAKIPKAQQKKVREFTKKFQANPTAASINYEKIAGVRDDKVRTVRIGLDYRAVILHPDRGDVHILVWVDHHDEAMAWAANKTFPINPITGAIQVVNFEQAIQPQSARMFDEPRLLDGISDAHLFSFGVPEIFLPTVRAIRSKEELIGFAAYLPAESAEALMWLSEGIPAEEVLVSYAGAKETQNEVDTTDFEQALKHPDSQRRFVTIESEQDLEAMLNAPLDKWRVFLHPSQRKLVTKHFNGPARVLGGAGTGKTVVAMHRAKHLAKNVFTETADRVLFVTFTGNLSKNIQQNLRVLDAEAAERIEVINLHSWAIRFLREQGSKFDIVTDIEAGQCWQEAMRTSPDLPWDSGFVRQEWNQVIQVHGITALEDYIKVSRMGRGKILSRPDRVRLWKTFEAYRERLQEIGKIEWLDVIRSTRRYLESNKGKLRYRAVVVDETQDLHAEELRLVRAIVAEGPNNLFLVGDAHQRIYDRKVVLSQCGINVKGRSSRLEINYRTTEQIRSWGVTLLRGMEVDDLDGGIDSQAAYKSLLSGPAPEVKHFRTLRQEQDFVRETVRTLVADNAPEDICVVAAKKSLLSNHYEQVLKEAGIPCVILDKNEGSPTPGVRLATMHRVKGLEFRCVIMAGINDGVVPAHHPSISADATLQRELESRERALLFVAATRARDRLIVSSWGSPSTYIAHSTE